MLEKAKKVSQNSIYDEIVNTKISVFVYFLPSLYFLTHELDFANELTETV